MVKLEKPEDNPFIESSDLDFKDVNDISEEEAEEEVEELREAVEYHDYRYYVKNDSVISDKAYDQLFHRLRALEEKFDLKTENSPTQRVGGEPVEEPETREHFNQMLSLDSSEEEEEVRRFDERVTENVGKSEYHIEPKFDGLSVEFVYRDSSLEAAVTRGNGVEGEDITNNVRTIGSVPLRLHGAPDLLVVRGEIYMPQDGFQELNRKRVERGEEPFANTRNAAAGTVRQLDPDVVSDRPLDVFFYDIMVSSAEVEIQEEAMALLEDTGLKVNEYNRLVDSIDEFIKYRNEMMDRREELNYDIDGVVIKVNDFDKRSSLGETSTHPRWAFAYKFPAKTGETTVKDIAVQVGRTGKLTPVALLEPVDVKGVTISRASLHNEKQAQELGVSKGSKVKIERAGDVIPQVSEVLQEGEETFRMPDNCPVCGSEVVGEKEHHYCTGGISCPAQLKRKLQYFASKEAMDIQGMGEKVAAQLVDEELVTSVPDLYRLEKDDLMELEKFADRSAEKLLEEIEESKNIDMASVITALGIRHVGKETARDLSRNFSLEQLIDAGMEELMVVEDIGPEVAKSIVSFFDGKGKNLVEELLEEGVSPERETVSQELEDLKLVFTGTLDDYSRSEITELIERHGADVTSSVSSETDYLVAGENPGERKMDSADKNNISIIDEQEFREKILSKIM